MGTKKNTPYERLCTIAEGAGYWIGVDVGARIEYEDGNRRVMAALMAMKGNEVRFRALIPQPDTPHNLDVACARLTALLYGETAY